MFRKNLKVSVCSFMVGILIAISATSVLAASAKSPWGYYGPFLGHYYKNQAEVWSISQGVFGVTWAQQDGYENVPTGYIGVKARLFKNDVLYESSNWRYNSSSVNGMSTGTNTVTSSGIYYSKGLSAAYNGDGYSTYYTFQSPSINY